jgi:glucose/arabinose dehydrogenase
MTRGAAPGAAPTLPAARVMLAACLIPATRVALAVCVTAGACLAFAAPRAASAQAVLPTGFADQLVVGGLAFPTGIAFLPDGRLLFVEQNSARIRLLVNDALAATDPVATVPSVRIGGERGLLGIAVDPGFPARPYVYVHCNDASALVVRISRFTVGGDLSFTGDGSLTINTATRYDLIANVPDLSSNHNGGTLRFGPDGMLYASFGEDNAGCAAQDTSGLRGVILRLDVSRLPPGAGGPAPRALITPPGNPFPNGGLNARLIWAFGLRNPFRFHIDPLNGALFIADVGSDTWEEIDRAPAGGLDFGWIRFEGPDEVDPACELQLPETPPIDYYAHGPSGQFAVISAGLYRPPAGASRPFPGVYDGDYFFGDYYLGFLRRLKGSGTSWSVAPPAPGQADPDNWATGLQQVSDYAVGPDGSLWFCRQFVNPSTPTGEIRRIVRTSTVGIPRPHSAAGPSFATPYPSPSAGAIHFSYSLSEPAEVTLVILDLGGRIVRRLAGPEPQEARAHDRVWDGRDDRGRALPAGVYRAVLTVGGRTLERKAARVR